MPLGVVSDDEFEKEIRNSRVEIDKKGSPVIGIKDFPLEDETPVVDGEIAEQKLGRGQGNNEVPESLRKIIAQTNLESGRGAAISLAQSFGISESSVSAYLSGTTSTASTIKDKDLSSFISNLKKKGARRAGQKLLKALENITEDKLEEAPAGVLASIAKSLSGVVKDLEPEAPNANAGVMAGVQFVVFAPQVVQESKFGVIELNE